MIRYAAAALLLLCSPAASQDEILAGITCIAADVSNDTAVGVYVWQNDGQRTFEDALATAIAQAAQDCGMVLVLQALPEDARQQIIMDALDLIAKRGAGLTV